MKGSRTGGNHHLGPLQKGRIMIQMLITIVVPEQFHILFRTEITQLLTACAMMREGSSEGKNGLRLFSELLSNRSPDSDWSVGTYGALAVRSAIRIGDPEQASRILVTAIQHSPTDPQLNYLSRILERFGYLKMTQSNGNQRPHKPI